MNQKERSKDLAPWQVKRQSWIKNQYCIQLWNDDSLSRTDLEYIVKELSRMLKED